MVPEAGVDELLPLELEEPVEPVLPLPVLEPVEPVEPVAPVEDEPLVPLRRLVLPELELGVEALLPLPGVVVAVTPDSDPLRPGGFGLG